jgi:hypothetical protein
VKRNNIIMTPKAIATAMAGIDGRAMWSTTE